MWYFIPSIFFFPVSGYSQNHLSTLIPSSCLLTISFLLPPFSSLTSVFISILSLSLSISVPIRRFRHFHLFPWGLDMSPRDLLVRLSYSGRAPWLWQTSFNWEEARRVWKNSHVYETPFIRHNLNSAWKKNLYVEKKVKLPPAVKPPSSLCR